MLGPRQRTERILRNVAAEGGRPIDEGRVYAPVGLDIGTDGAEQVALAVIAELLAVRSGRRARSLRERRVAIHAPGGRGAPRPPGNPRPPGPPPHGHRAEA